MVRATVPPLSGAVLLHGCFAFTGVHLGRSHGAGGHSFFFFGIIACRFLKF
jgi:hypothetical protein